MKWFLIAVVFSSSFLLGSEEVRVRVDGLVCSFCAQGVEVHLKKIAGVEKVEVDIDSGEVVIISKEPIPVEKIEQAISEAGYTVSSR